MSFIMLTPIWAIFPPANSTKLMSMNQKNRFGSWLNWSPCISVIVALPPLGVADWHGKVREVEEVWRCGAAGVDAPHFKDRKEKHCNS